MENLKERFDELLIDIDRGELEELITHLEEIGFYKAPCSTQYHGAYEGGLLEHSLNVCDYSVKVAEVLGYENLDSVKLVALLHDVGKAGYYDKQNYLPNILKSGKISEAKPYEINKELLGIPHEVAGLHIVNKFIDLTEEEAFAIVFHNGMYTGLGRELRGNETPLQMIIHFADMWDSRVNRGVLYA